MRASYLYVAGEMTRKLPKAQPSTLELAKTVRARRLKRNIYHSVWRSENLPKIMLNRSKARAKAQGMTFDLTEDWIRERFEVCELSGLKLACCTDSPGPLSPSVDRINSKFGYTQANCRVICMALNVAFNRWGEEAVKPILNAWFSKCLTNQP